MIRELTIEPAMIDLRDGPTVAEPAVMLALVLADRGIELRVNADGHLRAGPRGLLTAADAAAIAEHRGDLIRIVKYCDAPPEVR